MNINVQSLLTILTFLWFPFCFAVFILYVMVLGGPNANLSFFATLIFALVQFWPILIGLIFYINKWNFLDNLQPSIFFALTVIVPLCTVLGIYGQDLLATAKGISRSGYSILTDAVYWNAKPINDADPRTATKLGTKILKDKNHVFVLGEIRSDAEAATFHQIEKTVFFLDSNRVFVFDYYTSTASEALIELPGARPQSFKVLNGHFASDENQVYYGKKRVPNVDAATFVALTEKAYVKDKNHVYYRDWEAYDEGSPTLKLKIVEGANPSTFEIISNGSEKKFDARDGDNLYLFGKRI